MVISKDVISHIKKIPNANINEYMCKMSKALGKYNIVNYKYPIYISE